LEKINFSLNGFIDLKNAYSISGLSLQVFKKNFNSFSLSLKTSLDFDNLVRPAYYGGRCEVFGNLVEGEKCLHFDFSGMYTNRLLDDYPYGSYNRVENVMTITSSGFYFVSVFSNLDLPILPYRDENSGKLLFPNGNFYGLYWGEELLLFLEFGGVITKIYYGLEFKLMAPLFAKFGEFCANSRKKSQYEKVL
jgi:hypothetical protein